MSTVEACDDLGITLRTLYRIIDEGKLPCYQFGRALRIRTADMETFLTSAKVKPGGLRHLYPEPVEDKVEEERPPT